MTNEELRQKYRLLKLVVEQGERTYQALDADGHIVMVHHLQADSPDTKRLLALLEALSPADKMRIIERFDVDGAPVLVTQFIQGFKTLATWLQGRTQRPYVAPTSPPKGPGDVTAMFGPPAAAQPLTVPGPLTPVEPPRVAPAVQHPAGPGDVTLAFGAPTAQQPSPAQPPAAPPPPPRTAAAGTHPAPGDFTGLFGAASGTPAAPVPPTRPPDPASPSGDRPATPQPNDKPSVRWREPTAGDQSDASSERPIVRWKKGGPLEDPRAAPQAPPPPPPASTPRKGPGEFTRLFGPSGSAPADPTAPPATPPPPGPRPPAGPGEFTQMFQPERKFSGPPPILPERAPRDYLQALNAPAAPPGPPLAPGPPAPAPGKPPGEFTRLMAGIPAAPIGGQPASVPRPAASTGGAGGPSDFTRIIGGTAAASPTASPPPEEAPADEAPKRRSPRLVVLLIALGVICVMGVAVVLYFALKNP